MTCALRSRTIPYLCRSHTGLSNSLRHHGWWLDTQSQTHTNSSVVWASSQALRCYTVTKRHRDTAREISLRRQHSVNSRNILLRPSRSHSNVSTASDEQDINYVLSRFHNGGLSGNSSTYGWDQLERDNAGSVPSTGEPQKEVNIYGYITAHRLGKKVDFLTLVDPSLQRSIQVVCSANKIEEIVAASYKQEEDGHHSGNNRSIRSHTPVHVVATVNKALKLPSGLKEGNNILHMIDQHVGELSRIGHIELQASTITILNQFPSTLVAKSETNFPPEKRYLQFRTDAGLRKSIRMRSRIKAACSSFLLEQGFVDVETPVLFKSTPEGAREFVVPTRKRGFAYALPQSPQQYKQVLMASGIPRYFQFARCFRDEDLRADRQPEFTQLDLEMSFVSREDVMSVIEQLVLDVVWPVAERSSRLPSSMQKNSENDSFSPPTKSSSLRLPIFTYQEVMSKYGSDKPDPRLGAEIVQINGWVPLQFQRMLTDLDDPIVEMIHITTHDKSPRKSREVMAAFMDLPESEVYLKGKYGMAGISIYDPMQPLCGLAAFGHEAASQVEEMFQLEEGDILIAQVRPNAPFHGGSTVLGNMRRDLLRFAVEHGLIEPPAHDSLFWVVDFPLFSPTEQDAPGQEGQAGICSTHHPFTAPRAGQDLSNLLQHPLSIIGDHYDLVVNGTEVGGGSRRIHHPEMQELIFRDVLKMKHDRVEDFRHLLLALAAGCPPHAGIALGFDRLIALLLDKESVREVIAFPKWGDGEDKFAGSPSQLTAGQLSTYHLKVTDTGTEPEES